MAKYLLLLATLLVAVAVAAEATTPAVTLPHSSVKGGLSINVACRGVTFKLMSPVVSNPVVALKGKWTAKQTTLQESVTVENNKHVVVSKTVTIDLLKHFKMSELKDKKFLVLTAVESWSCLSKYLLITMGEVVVLSIKL